MVSFKILEKVALAIIFFAAQVHSQNYECTSTVHTQCKTEADIVGISNVSDGVWPWMVAITEKPDSDFRCNGFLIDRKHVLSVAHCFEGIKTATARIGKVNMDEADKYSISQITVPGSYKPGHYEDDIAILTLSRDVDTPGFVPLSLPDDEILHRYMTGLGAMVVAWGQKSHEAKLVLQESRGFTVISNEDCNRIYQERINGFHRQFPNGITNDALCTEYPAGEPKVCYGTSGAPLILRERNQWFAIGIVSFGLGCGDEHTPDVYTRISSYISWIRENTRD